MGGINYKDFELSIEKRGGQRYHAKVQRSLCGEPDIDFKLPFTKLELENFILKIGSARRVIRRINSPEMQTAREFGSKLFESIFSGDVHSCLISSQNEAIKEGYGLRIKLRLQAPELINIPWEFLYDATHGRFLALFERTPIVRYIDILDRTKPLKVELPLSMLVMISSPNDLPALDIHREKANLEKAIKELSDIGLIQVTWMDQATLPALVDQLLCREYHIFHFIGHGGFDEKNQDGILVMEDEFQQSYFVSGERLAVLLGNQANLRMVVLNSCEGGRTSSTDPFAGVATTLVRTGSVSAVVAMQLAITDRAAILFSRGLYNALSIGRPVDSAVTQARLAIFADSNDIEWATPVLYMRSPDGIIFDIETLSQEEREKLRFKAQEEENRQEMLAELYEGVKEKLDREEWSAAYDLLLQIRKIDPGYQNIADLLSRVKNEMKRSERKAELISQGKESMGKGEWARAVQTFQQALSIIPEDAEIQRLLAEANFQANQQVERQRKEEHERRILPLYNQAASKMKARDWAGALTVLSQVSQLDPAYRDVSALIEQARAEKSKVEQVSAYLLQARTSLEQKEWSRAAEILGQALELDPECVEAQSLLIEAHTGIEEEKARVTVEHARQEKEEKARQAEQARFAAEITLREKEEKARLEEQARLERLAEEERIKEEQERLQPGSAIPAKQEAGEVTRPKRVYLPGLLKEHVPPWIRWNYVAFALAVLGGLVLIVGGAGKVSGTLRQRSASQTAVALTLKAGSEISTPLPSSSPVGKIILLPTFTSMPQAPSETPTLVPTDTSTPSPTQVPTNTPTFTPIPWSTDTPTFVPPPAKTSLPTRKPTPNP